MVFIQDYFLIYLVFYFILLLFYRTLIQKIQNVTSEDMKSIAEKYIRPLLDPKTTLSAIVCHNSKYEEVARRFSE